MSFAQFYQEGGGFMHLITIVSVVAAGMIVAHIGELRRARRSGRATRLHGLSLIASLAKGTLLLGSLGVLFGMMELSAAIGSVPLDQWPRALARGGAIAIHPLAWALVCSIPILFAKTLLQHTAARRSADAHARAEAAP